MIPTSGSNVSGTPPGHLLRGSYYEDKGPLFISDVAESREREEEPVKVPEPVKKVRIRQPFMCAYQGTQYFPDEVAEVPESIADYWIVNQWVVPESPEKVVVEQPVEQPRKRR
jgi:hypothetical protein